MNNILKNISSLEGFVTEVELRATISSEDFSGKDQPSLALYYVIEPPEEV